MKKNRALKLVDEIILYYDARSKKHQKSSTCFEQYYAHPQEVKLYVYSNGIITLYEWSRWPCSTQVERELSSISTCVLYDHDDHSQRVTIQYAVYIQFDLLRMSIILLETYRGL